MTVETGAAPAEISPSSTRLFWRRFRAQRGAVIGGVIVAVVVVVALFAPLLAPHPYAATDLLNTWSRPGAENLLGTDELGRDTLSRLIYGARTSLTVAGAVLAITLFVGVTIGMVAGYVGGKVDVVLMRIVDVTLGFPEVIFAILVASILGPGTLTVVVALALVWWTGAACISTSFAT